MKWYEVVPVEECSFLAVDKPQKMRFSAEQVELNFGSRSPWPTGRILFRQDSEKLYLWFVKGQPEGSYKVQVPEGYLLAKPFLDHSESILVYGKNTGDIFTVIHKGRLAAQMASALATDPEQDVQENVSLLEKEFSMKSAEVIRIPEGALPSPTVKDLWDFQGMNFDRALLLKALEWVKNGAIAFLFISAFYTLFDYNSLQRRVEKKEQQVQKMQQQNSSFRQRMLNISQKSELWREFSSAESGPATWMELMDALAESFRAQNGYLKSVRFSGSELIVQAGLKGTAPELVKQLLTTGFFAESKIISTEGDPHNPGTDLVNIRLVIRPSPEVKDG